ncbi:MAG: HAD-IA family hydrolase [Planctomycetota bacterium]|nr:HAD-IA family hydrolase [Planctomycetota bacterium]
MSQLKAILFDIDDTLFPTSEFALAARKAAVKAMVEAGLDFPEEVVLAELLEVIAEFSSNYSQHFNKLLHRLDPDRLRHGSPALVIAAGVSAYHDTKFRKLAPFDDVVPFLEFARGLGLRLGIVSHGWTDKQAEKLVRLGVVPYLEPKAIFISEDIGINKPNPKLYQRALAKLGLQPSEAMYIGDSPAHDVAPTRSIGMVSVWARRASKWRGSAGDFDVDHVIDSFDELRPILEANRA